MNRSGQEADVQPIARVIATDDALVLIAELEERYGPLLFHQSGGCCDGSSPMCYPRNDYILGEEDVQIGEIGGHPFCMSSSQFRLWQHTRLIIDVVPGRGGMFSLENGTECRFLTRSRLYSDEELKHLTPIPFGL